MKSQADKNKKDQSFLEVDLVMQITTLQTTISSLEIELQAGQQILWFFSYFKQNWSSGISIKPSLN